MASPGMRVLLAVADARLAKTAEGSLTDRDSVVARAADMEELLAALDRAAPDVVLFDLALADGHPESTVESLVARAPTVPVVALVPSGGESAGLEAVSLGATDYLLPEEAGTPLLPRILRHAVERARVDKALSQSELRYRTLFEQSRDAIFVAGAEGEVLEINQAAVELLGYGQEEIRGRKLHLWFADPADHERLDADLLLGEGVRDVEVRLLSKEGRELFCLLSYAARRSAQGDLLGYQGIIHDITDRKRVEEQLLHDAFHDPLTGLPNRNLFLDRLDRALARRARNPGTLFALLFLDLDRFKVVNDSLGHHVGDRLLVEVGERLSSCLRESDTVARLGGDEFAILVDGVEHVSDATHVAERIQALLEEPFELEGRDAFTSASIGIIVTGAEGHTAEALLRDADIAMYRAKSLGRATYQLFDPEMHALARGQLQLETDLRHAIDRGEFLLHYQPIVAAETGDLIGFEALLRWQHPERGLLHPEVFIPAAEETGLIVPVGLWVLREACRQLQAWREGPGGSRLKTISVNLSARQFLQVDLVREVERILEETGLPPECLNLELTESVLMSNADLAAESLTALAELGVRLCIDDFGTGYSSLSYLQRFPIHTLKIDRSFVSGMGSHGEHSELVQTIVALARNLGMEAVAEGVETREQLGQLRTLGSRFVQGFLFSTPLDERAASELVVQARHWDD